jgi:hypothetical protein
MGSITSLTCLEPGARVQVGNRRGSVKSSKLVSGHNCEKIVINTIVFDERFKRGFGRTGRWEPIKKTKPQGIGYAFIQTL